MAIPLNISKHHILKAIKRIDDDVNFNPKRKERVWALKFNDKLYPCKLVISYANVYPNKQELESNPKVFTTYMAQRFLKSKGFNNIIRIERK